MGRSPVDTGGEISSTRKVGLVQFRKIASATNEITRSQRVISAQPPAPCKPRRSVWECLLLLLSSVVPINGCSRTRCCSDSQTSILSAHAPSTEHRRYAASRPASLPSQRDRIYTCRAAPAATAFGSEELHSSRKSNRSLGSSCETESVGEGESGTLIWKLAPILVILASSEVRMTKVD